MINSFSFELKLRVQIVSIGVPIEDRVRGLPRFWSNFMRLLLVFHELDQTFGHPGGSICELLPFGKSLLPDFRLWRMLADHSFLFVDGAPATELGEHGPISGLFCLLGEVQVVRT